MPEKEDYDDKMIIPKVLLTTFIASILIFSTAGISYQQVELPFDNNEEEEAGEDGDEEAGEDGDEVTACIDYEAAENTIAINCNASFLDVVQAINDPEILEQENDGQYILNANLEVSDGITFKMNSSGDNLQYLKISGENGIIVHGRIEISGIKITSWDTETDSPVSQTETGSVPRTFINLRVSEGGFIENSEVAHIGYAAPPRRGIDLGERGEGASHDFAIRNSTIHDNWMGFYSAEAYNITIDGNEFFNNILYAIDPHTATHNMTVSNNKIHNNHGIAVICSLDCYNIIYEQNEVYDNVESGLMFSRATHDSIIRNNLIYNQYGSAYPISIFESRNNEIYGNIIRNSTTGISVHNPVELDEDGMSSGNRIYNNTFDGVQNGIRALASSDNIFSNNIFGNVTDFHYTMSSDATMGIENQTFDMVNVRGFSGDNTLSIRNSGTIIIDNTTEHNTALEPYAEVLSDQSMKIDSAR
jgi:parallel beta-helix repeat protein